MERIRLLLIDRHMLFREGLSRVLASEFDFRVVGTCGTYAQALDVLVRACTDVVLLDSHFGEENWQQFILAARQVGYTGKILMVTAGMTAEESTRALHAGASGVFFKHNSSGTLARVIRQIAGGEVWLDRKVIELMIEMAPRHEEEENSERRLTERQERVLKGILDGLTNKEIAGQLGATESSVKATLQALFQKTRVRTRSQLVRVALETAKTGALGVGSPCAAP